MDDFCEKLPEVSPMSDGTTSKLDSLLAKTEPISDGGSTSRVTYNLCQISVLIFCSTLEWSL